MAGFLGRRREHGDGVPPGQYVTHDFPVLTAGPTEVVRTDRGDLTAPLIVDALGWRRVLAANGYQPPDAPLSRGLEVHPEGGGDDRLSGSGQSE